MTVPGRVLPRIALFECPRDTDIDRPPPKAAVSCLSISLLSLLFHYISRRDIVVSVSYNPSFPWSLIAGNKTYCLTRKSSQSSHRPLPLDDVGQARSHLQPPSPVSPVATSHLTWIPHPDRSSRPTVTSSESALSTSSDVSVLQQPWQLVKDLGQGAYG